MNDTSGTQSTRMQHECYTNDTSATRVKHFGFDNDASENIFSHLYLSFMTNERLQGEEQFHSKNYLVEMSRSHPKMNLKKAPQKLNSVMAKVLSKSYTLDCGCKCPCTFPHSYAYSNTALFLIKTTLRETNNILFSKNYLKLGKMTAGF